MNEFMKSIMYILQVWGWGIWFHCFIPSKLHSFICLPWQTMLIHRTNLEVLGTPYLLFTYIYIWLYLSVITVNCCKLCLIFKDPIPISLIFTNMWPNFIFSIRASHYLLYTYYWIRLQSLLANIFSSIPSYSKICHSFSSFLQIGNTPISTGCSF